MCLKWFYSYFRNISSAHYFEEWRVEILLEIENYFEERATAPLTYWQPMIPLHFEVREKLKFGLVNLNSRSKRKDIDSKKTRVLYKNIVLQAVWSCLFSFFSNFQFIPPFPSFHWKVVVIEKAYILLPQEISDEI